MKINSFRYLINQGLKSIWTNRMMSFASFCIMLVSLLMVGLSVLLSVNLNRIIGGIEDKSEVVVQIKDNITDEATQELQDKIKQIPNVSTVEFYSKESAWENMMEDMTEEERELFQYADDNPLPDTFRLTVADIQKMTETTTQIETFENVESTKSPTAFADVLISIRRILTVISAAIVLALIIVCLIIISNTTRTSVFARRKEINIMKYVGATNSFIRIPFFVEGMIVGILAAAGALLLTKFAYEGVYNIFNDDFKLWNILGVKNLYSFKDMFWPVTIAYAAAGALIGAIGTSISAGKHLKV
ncbi:permease-like cell division protein FtsX [Ruminococcus sp. Marseille-P6503]|uniref:permease-like cell division protein FtsX n=1 Tax=Ruminococcus sp. Marseille-P6503 TaxID=2364796 RepID=UPI000F539971|nr:permease-like cell division protein FtsX [Ruminococcus sp. Marseille-P6503]